MVSTTTLRHFQSSQQRSTKIRKEEGSAINHAVRLIHAVCGLAGSPTLIDEIRAELRADKVSAAIRNRDTGPVFDWLMAAVSYQGISDQVAYGYMEKHGRATWRQIKQGLDCGVSCPKLKSYTAMSALRHRGFTIEPCPSLAESPPCRPLSDQEAIRRRRLSSMLSPSGVQVSTRKVKCVLVVLMSAFVEATSPLAPTDRRTSFTSQQQCPKVSLRRSGPSDRAFRF
jgi:hypothetical protein